MTMKKIFLLSTIFLVTISSVQSQVQQQSGWFASFNTIKLNDKFSIHAELQIRSTDDWEHVQTVLPRVGLNYHVKPNQILTAGYAYIPNRSVIGDESNLLGEHRIWQQYLITHKAWRASVTHRFRLEERFVPTAALVDNEVEKNGSLYSTRFRYFIRGLIPFTKQQPFTRGMFGALQNELFLNITNKNNVNDQVFDQNRAYAAIGYRFSKKMDIEIGYMSQYQARRPLAGSSKNNDLSNNIVQLAVYTRL